MIKHPDYFHLGKIIRTHGIMGNLIAVFDTDKPNAYLKLDTVYLEKNNSNLLPQKIKSITLRGGEFLLSFQGVSTPEQAALWKGCDIYLPLDKLPKPSKNEFYFHDLVGCTIEDTVHGTLGTVDSILEATGQNLIAFNYHGKEVLLPFVKNFVLDIDLNNKIVKTQLPEGLLEIYMEDPKKGEETDEE